MEQFLFRITVMLIHKIDKFMSHLWMIFDLVFLPFLGQLIIFKKGTWIIQSWGNHQCGIEYYTFFGKLDCNWRDHRTATAITTKHSLGRIKFILCLIFHHILGIFLNTEYRLRKRILRSQWLKWNYNLIVFWKSFQQKRKSRIIINPIMMNKCRPRHTHKRL